MKEEDAPSIVQIFVLLKVQHIPAISEDLAGPPLAGQLRTESTGSALRSSAPSPALAFSIKHLSHPRSWPSMQPIL